MILNDPGTNITTKLRPPIKQWKNRPVAHISYVWLCLKIGSPNKTHGLSLIIIFIHSDYTTCKCWGLVWFYQFLDTALCFEYIILITQACPTMAGGPCDSPGCLEEAALTSWPETGSLNDVSKMSCAFQGTVCTS